jgi:tRNA G10  N-methylase Trm11
MQGRNGQITDITVITFATIPLNKEIVTALDRCYALLKIVKLLKSEYSYLIFKEFFYAIYDNMKDDAYLCMASPHYVDLKPMVDEVGFVIVEQYGIKMHRSLTRIISVIRKKV